MQTIYSSPHFYNPQHVKPVELAATLDLAHFLAASSLPRELVSVLKHAPSPVQN